MANKNKKILRPVIKWAGGKTQLLPELSKRYPASLGKEIRKYAEPFIGGGAVLLDILAKYELDELYISDINAELINMYNVMKNDIDSLVDGLKDCAEKYIPLDTENRKLFYYEKRQRYNDLIISGESGNSLESAVLFILLNRTCFNGLYRVNAKGLFNVPMGEYKNPKICDEENLRAVAEALQKVTVVCGDYRDSDSFIDKKTFAYFDPPYRPLNITSSFNSYTEDDFNDECQKELAEYAQKLSAKGAYTLLSNSDPKNTNPDDNFFDDLYANFKIERLKAKRMINSKGNGRGEITELLISNY